MYSDTESGGGGERRVEISRGPRRTRDPLRESEWTSPALIHVRAQRRQSKCRHRDREGPHQVAAARDAGAGDAGGGDATIVVGKGHRQLHWTKDGSCREPLWAVSGASGGLGRANRRGKRGGVARCARRGLCMRGCGRAVARTHRANEECGSGFGVRGQCFLHVSLATPNVLALHGLAWEKRSRGRHTERRRDTEGVSGIGRRTAGKQQRSPAREERTHRDCLVELFSGEEKWIS